MRKPEFEKVDDNLWQWHNWWIAFAHGAFWLLTPVPRECGPFQFFEEARQTAEWMC